MHEETTSGRLSLVGLTKTFESGGAAVTAVDNVNLNIEPGEFITLLGPSGCGKTTTLRMIAGFENATAGQVLLDGENMVVLPPNKRPMAMVFQSYALFPHLNVRENVAYGLKLKKVPKAQLEEEVEVALAAMNLTAMADREPNQMSGGQQQRVALARAMVMKPKVLLFDEPLSNLDAKLRVKMRLEIRRLQRRLGITSIYVTHDQSEAMSLSDRIVVMNSGRIEQVASPAEIYRHPASMFVADFVGRANFIPAQLLSLGEESELGVRAQVAAMGKEFTVQGPRSIGDAHGHMLLVRPESLHLKRAELGDTPQMQGNVLAAVFYGEHVEYEIETEVGTLISIASDVEESQIFREGESVALSFAPERSWILPENSER
ncbi:MAG: ABC transporter ATP-binding protein [Arcanobacterium sp.]|nr:ABC transporter ATP-binding protein [Arcanobacterium sp.]MDY5589267.1 ABC transporter ATP-binding protein [Arcanobacterium sp.]